MSCPSCTRSFNQSAPRAQAKPAIALHDICPCYRPKVTLG